MHLVAGLQAIQVHAAGQRAPVAIPSIPHHRVDPGVAPALHQGGHLLSGKVVEGQFDRGALWQGKADDGAAVEGVGVVLLEGEGLGPRRDKRLQHRGVYGALVIRIRKLRAGGIGLI